MGDKGSGGNDSSDYANAMAAGQAGYGYGAETPWGYDPGQNLSNLGAGGSYNPSSPWAGYWEEGYARGIGSREDPNAGAGGFHFPAFAMPHAPSGASARAAAEAAQQAALRAAGEQERDFLYSDYMDAAGSAADFINAEISGEQSNANLLGIDYAINDEQKQTRVENYFASIWGAGQQTQLEALVGKWGKPKGFEGYTVTRGDASQYMGVDEGEEESRGVSRGIRPSPTLATADSEEVLGQAALLGA